jgi:membrane protein DedA with SNARE-associated domain
MEPIVKFIVATVGSLGYLGIFAMMFLESSFFPFPSEVVMIPAGYLAQKGDMNFFMAVFMGILGSVAGAVFNYYIALKFGRAGLLKIIKEEKLKKLETFFENHGHISTFSGRLIPGIRQYISLPAGLAKMNITVFVLFTALGAGIWVIILTALGYFIGENEAVIKSDLHHITLILVLIVCFIIYLYYRKKKQ